MRDTPVREFHVLDNRYTFARDLSFFQATRGFTKAETIGAKDIMQLRQEGEHPILITRLFFREYRLQVPGGSRTAV